MHPEDTPSSWAWGTSIDYVLNGLQLEDCEKRINLILRHYTERYAHADDHIYFGGDDTAVYIGYYELKTYPADQDKLYEKITSLMKIITQQFIIYF